MTKTFVCCIEAHTYSCLAEENPAAIQDGGSGAPRLGVSCEAIVCAFLLVFLLSHERELSDMMCRNKTHTNVTESLSHEAVSAAKAGASIQSPSQTVTNSIKSNDVQIIATDPTIAVIQLKLNDNLTVYIILSRTIKRSNPPRIVESKRCTNSTIPRRDVSCYYYVLKKFGGQLDSLNVLLSKSHFDKCNGYYSFLAKNTTGSRKNTKKIAKNELLRGYADDYDIIFPKPAYESLYFSHVNTKSLLRSEIKEERYRGS